MRGLDPRIHVFVAEADVDGRIKSGHDGWGVGRFSAGEKHPEKS
tara:strand:- start:13700 stop:13831 length:132 start_codon:yes stop_codon:yes gene_type:complete